VNGFPVSCGSAVEWRYDRPWTPAEFADFFYRRCAPRAVGTFSDYTKAQRKTLLAEARAAQPPPRRRYFETVLLPTISGPAPAPQPVQKFKCPPGWIPCIGLTGIRCFPAELCTQPATDAQARAAGLL